MKGIIVIRFERERIKFQSSPRLSYRLVPPPFANQKLRIPMVCFCIARTELKSA